MTWTVHDRQATFSRLSDFGAELVVIGGGITGAGILRDAALRGLKAVLFERDDFASGTSSHTSKMIHGGLRYLAEGQLGVTRESCLERDLLARLNPNLVRPLPFMLCAFDGGVAPWKMTVGLTLYSAIAGFRGGGGFKLLGRSEIEHLSRDVRKHDLRAAGMYYDQQVDDARIVLETIKDARRAGAEAVHHAEVIGFAHDRGRIAGVHVRCRLSGEEHTVRAQRFVNATGPCVDRVRAFDRGSGAGELRPAKGVHIVIARERVHAEAAISFQADDGRHLFLCPFRDVHLIGTTDTFTDDIDEPRVTRADVEYVLAAVNRAFPWAHLSQRDFVSVYAGVRPLVSDEHDEAPPSKVSREHRITQDESGLLSVAGGKLTTYRRMAEQIVDRVVSGLAPERRERLRACATRERPLRLDMFVREELARELSQGFSLDERTVDRLISSYGEEALNVLSRAPAPERTPIGRSRFLACEVRWAIEEECAANLCDVLARRVRVAVFAPGQGLDQLDRLARIAGDASGWSEARAADEAARYRELVRSRYQVAS